MFKVGQVAYIRLGIAKKIGVAPTGIITSILVDAKGRRLYQVNGVFFNEWELEPPVDKEDTSD